MGSTLYLHIGTIKTGSTTLQKFLLQNQKQLARHDVALPSLLGETLLPVRLATALGNPDVVAFHHATNTHVRKEALEYSLSYITQTIARECGEKRARHNVVSWEGLPIFFTNQKEIKHLHTLFSPHYDTIQIVVYLRRQDALAASLYGELLYQGKYAPLTGEEFSYTNVKDIYRQKGARHSLSDFDYSRLLEPWSAVFGDENIIVRPFERSQLVDGDVVADFLSLIDCPMDRLTPVPHVNVSLDHFQMEFLRKSQPLLPQTPEGLPGPSLLRMGQILHDEMPRSRPHTVDTAEASDFLASFAASNSRVATRYLGRENGELFTEQPPQENRAALPELTADKAVEIAATLWDTQWQAVQKRENNFISLQRNTSRHAKILHDTNTALYAMLLKATGNIEAAQPLLDSVVAGPNIDAVRSQLFIRFAVQNAQSLALYRSLCPEVLSLTQRLDVAAQSDSAVQSSDLPTPKHLLMFCSAPDFLCRDLAAAITEAWPDSKVDIVLQEGRESPLEAARSLRVPASPFSAENFFDAHGLDSLCGKYDLIIIPTNGDTSAYREFFSAAERLHSPACVVYKSWNLLLSKTDKLFEKNEHFHSA